MIRKKNQTPNDDFDKHTTINIQWLKRKGVRGLQWEVEGDKLPPEILKMLTQDFLQELKIPIRIEP